MKRIPLAIFCSPILAEQLQRRGGVKAADATEQALAKTMGVPLYFDPSMPSASFDVGYNASEIRERLVRIRSAEADNKNKP
jgi:hypothetical protein